MNEQTPSDAPGVRILLDRRGASLRDEPDPLYGLWHPRAVVPCASLRERILTAAHDGHLHLGREKTLSLIEQRYWWPGLSRDVARKCQNCETCAFNDRARRTGEAHIPPYGHQPWSCITADIVYLEPTASGYDSVLVPPRPLILVPWAPTAPKYWHVIVSRLLSLCRRAVRQSTLLLLWCHNSVHTAPLLPTGV